MEENFTHIIKQLKTKRTAARPGSISRYQEVEGFLFVYLYKKEKSRMLLKTIRDENTFHILCSRKIEDP